MSSFGIAVLLVLAALVVMSSPRVAFVCILIAIFAYHQSTKLDFGVISMSAYRIIVAVGILRVLIRKEKINGGITLIDKVMIAFSVVTFITGFLRDSSVVNVINRGGAAFDILGLYFLFRVLIADKDKYLFCLKLYCLLIFPLSLLLLFEKKAGVNLFSLFAIEQIPIVVRAEKIRASGPFLHPILAGSFLGVFFPFVLALWWQGKNFRLYSILGSCATVIGILSTASSGPIMALLFSILGFSCWKIRRYMRSVRWAIVVVIVLLQIAMKAPVWFLISKIDLTGSSTGWHRSELISQAIEHFDEWWLIGTNYTRHWMPYGIPADPNHTDITNHYLLLGVHGGMLLMVLFVFLQVEAFRNVGRYVKNHEGGDLADNLLAWAIGVSIFSQIMTFLSIPFFDQTVALVYLTIAFASAIPFFNDEKTAAEYGTADGAFNTAIAK